MEETRAAVFVIDGNDYEIPSLGTLTMAEAKVLYDYAGCVVEDFAPAHPSWSDDEKAAVEAVQLRRVRNPAFKQALVHIAYQRGNPDMPAADVRAVVDNVNMLEVTNAMIRQGEDALPPAESGSPTEQSRQPLSRTPSSPEGSGSPSTTGSDEQGATPEPTGTTGSGTSSPALALAKSGT